jgi:hypothetical protein
MSSKMSSETILPTRGHALLSSPSETITDSFRSPSSDGLMDRAQAPILEGTLAPCDQLGLKG